MQSLKLVCHQKIILDTFFQAAWSFGILLVLNERLGRDKPLKQGQVMMLGLLVMNLASRLILLMLYSGGYIEYPMAQNDSC